MQALLHQGSLDSTRLVPDFESASPTRSEVDKSTRSRACFPLVSDTSPVNCTLYTVLELRRSTTLLTLVQADHRQPGRPGHQSEIARRSRKPGEAVRRQALEERGASTQRKIARNDRRAPRGGRTRSSNRKRGLAPDPEDRAPRVTEGNPSEAVLCRLRCCSRWSA
jgi:hypothetical protein